MRDAEPNFPGLLLGLLMRVSKWWVFWIFWITVAVFFYKIYKLPYGPSYFGFEFSFVICWGIISFFRTQVGARGVARFNPLALWMFVISTFFAILVNIYLVFLQVYLLRIEFIFNSFCLGLELVELILGIVAALMYSKSQSL